LNKFINKYSNQVIYQVFQNIYWCYLLRLVLPTIQALV